MRKPRLSAHFATRMPSAIRLAQIEFSKRTDGVAAVNTAIGNVSLPMHPAMQRRMNALGGPHSPFSDGVVKYTSTVGLEETRQAFLRIIESSGFATQELKVQVTEGGSAAMELVIVGLCGPAGITEKPLLLIDAAYTNYQALASRTGRSTVSVSRHLQRNGKFSLPDMAAIAKVITEHKPGAMLVIPYDNPTGQFYDQGTLTQLASLCVEHNLWLVSDEAYRELYYRDLPTSSIWGLSESTMPGILGRRISIETASKVWNACGLRIGALVTDNQEFHTRSVAENTANLCPNAIGQYLMAALAEESVSSLQEWYRQQKNYYQSMLAEVRAGLQKKIPGLIMSQPDAAIYSVVDVRECTKPGFDAEDFVMYCARQGRVELKGQAMTLLTSPMAEFYSVSADQENPGKTQMRIAYVEAPEKMALVPDLLAALLRAYETDRNV